MGQLLGVGGFEGNCTTMKLFSPCLAARNSHPPSTYQCWCGNEVSGTTTEL